MFGPAWLVMMADMDASSTIGAAETGVVLKYSLIWFLLLLVIPLYFIQEASGRIGLVTGKGLGELVRENYSRRTAVLMAFPMALTDVLTYAVEYAGAAVGFAVFGVPPLISVPIVFLAHVFLVVGNKYSQAERALLALSPLLFLSFGLVLWQRGLKPYPFLVVSSSPSFLFLLAANVGAVIMPFMLFFQASATAIKWSTRKEGVGTGEAMKRVRVETFVGAIATEILMVFVEMSTAGLDPSTDFVSPRSLYTALASASPLAPSLFSVGLISAAFLALVVISLGSAWGVVEALGVERERAYMIYMVESVPAALVISLVPTSSLLGSILNLLVLLVFTLIGPGVILGLLISNEKVMGERRSKRLELVAYWASLIFVILFGFLAIL